MTNSPSSADAARASAASAATRDPLSEPLPPVEITFLGAGLFILFTWLLRSVRRGGLRAALRLDSIETFPPPPFGPEIVLVPFIWYVALQAMLAQAAAWQGLDTEPDGNAPLGLTLAINAVGQITTSALILLLVRSARGGTLRGWGVSPRGAAADAGRGILVYLAIWPIVSATAWGTLLLVRQVSPGAELPLHTTLNLLNDAKASPLLHAAAFISAGLLAPLFEELYFRGVLLDGLARAAGSRGTAVAATAMLFALMHTQTWQFMPALFVLGIVLGWLYARRRSMVAVVALHAAFNLKTLILALYDPVPAA